MGTGACFNSPLWRNDRYEVTGSLDGRTCRMLLNGETFSAEHEPVLVEHLWSTDPALRSGWVTKSIECGSMLLSVAAPEDLPPAPGSYRVTDQFGWPGDRVSAVVSSPMITAGAWPLAMNGVYLVGVSGTVQLDSITKTAAWGQFRIRGRRRAHSGG